MYFEILEVGRKEEIVAIVAAVTEFCLSVLEIGFEIHWQEYGTSYYLFFWWDSHLEICAWASRKSLFGKN